MKRIPYTAENRELVRRGLKTQTRRVTTEQKWQVGEVLALSEPLYGGMMDGVKIALYVDDDAPVILGNTTHSYLPWRWKHHWLNARFMPLAAARTFIRITAVRREQLQDITEDDAKAEGCASVEAYRELWDSINGKKHPWKNNPPVWVYSFELVSQT